MSKISAFITLFIALFAALFASYSVSKYVKEIQAQNADGGSKTISVVTAKTDIAAGVRIQSDMLTVMRMDTNALPEGIFTEMETVQNRVAVTQVFAGEIIVKQRLADEGTAAGLTAFIPDGYRAITLKVDDTIGVGGFIQPGHFVDVVTTVNVSDDSHELVSKVILQNVQVIATGKEIDKSETKKAKVVPTVTVLVTLEKAERIALATSAGHIRLVLRNFSDKSEDVTEGVTLANLIPQVRQESLTLPEPVMIERTAEAVKEEVYIVEVYRGSEKTEVTFQ